MGGTPQKRLGVRCGHSRSSTSCGASRMTSPGSARGTSTGVPARQRESARRRSGARAVVGGVPDVDDRGRFKAERVEERPELLLRPAEVVGEQRHLRRPAEPLQLAVARGPLLVRCQAPPLELRDQRGHARRTGAWPMRRSARGRPRRSRRPARTRRRAEGRAVGRGRARRRGRETAPSAPCPSRRACRRSRRAARGARRHRMSVLDDVRAACLGPGDRPRRSGGLRAVGLSEVDLRLLVGPVEVLRLAVSRVEDGRGRCCRRRRCRRRRGRRPGRARRPAGAGRRPPGAAGRPRAAAARRVSRSRSARAARSAASAAWRSASRLATAARSRVSEAR